MDGWGALIGVLQAHISHPLPCLEYKTMLSPEDEKQRIRRVCKNVSVRTLLQSFAALPGKEEMAPLTRRADLCYVDGWRALIGEHRVERCLDVCTPSTHQSLRCLQYKQMFSVSNPTRRHSNDDAQ